MESEGRVDPVERRAYPRPATAKSGNSTEVSADCFLLSGLFLFPLWSVLVSHAQQSPTSQLTKPAPKTWDVANKLSAILAREQDFPAAPSHSVSWGSCHVFNREMPQLPGYLACHPARIRPIQASGRGEYLVPTEITKVIWASFALFSVI
jgi:hypothetical protein